MKRTMMTTMSLILAGAAVCMGICLSARAAESQAASAPSGGAAAKPVMAGAYYFDGWAGHNRRGLDPNESWVADAPMMLTARLAKEFGDREPIWGWRDDSMEVMEKQIDAAADAGIGFFAFCWYWRADKGPLDANAIRGDSLHTAMELFLKAKNNRRMRFCLLVANHPGAEIVGPENWKAAGEFWLPYLKSNRYLTVDGNPLLIIFNPKGGDPNGFAAMQETARKAGLPGLAIASNGPNKPEWGAYTHRTWYGIIPGYWDGSVERPYSEPVKAHEAEWKGSTTQPFMPITSAGWDKRPWESPTAGEKDERSAYFTGRSPEQFARHVANAIEWMDKHPDETTKERILLIYAWNELGEGGYLVPTKGDPNGEYLKALKSVLKPTTQPSVGDGRHE